MSTKSAKLSPSPFDLTAPHEWGPEKYGRHLVICSEGSAAGVGPDIVIDVEDDEQGGFVGCGVYDGGKLVLYFTSLSQSVKDLLVSRQLVGHNLKSDFHKLRKWGVNVRPEQLKFDTMIASYVMDSTKESHGLKELAKTECGIKYPEYRQIVGSGRKKATLDKHSVGLVAAYNGMDCLSTHALWEQYDADFTAEQRKYFLEIEMPITRLLFQMEAEGIKVDLPYLTVLDNRFKCESERLLAILRRQCGQHFNPASPAQVANGLFPLVGCTSTKTGKEVLTGMAGIPLIQTLLRFREITKLSGTYTSPLSSLANGVEDQRIHTTFNQVAVTQTGEFKGIRTGRLSSSEPNLHNIPTRTQTGDLLRRAFVALTGYVLICADYSQIEWRIAAHYSEDKEMIRTILSGEDPYQKVADRAKKSRRDTKTAMLAMNFGAGGYKIASVLKISDTEGFKFVRAYEDTFPEYFKWRRKIERQPHIDTLLGRRIKPASDNLKVPYLVQGSAADVIKAAMLKLVTAGHFPLLQVHDELLFEVPVEAATVAVAPIRKIMENVVTLRVPLIVKPGIGTTWQEAKG